MPLRACHMVRWSLAMLLCPAPGAAMAAELPEVGAPPAPVAGERAWDFADQGEFTGTLVGIVGGKARIRLPDGVVREFEPGWSKGGSAAALRRAMCRIPDHSARPALGGGGAPVIQLSADQLPAGALTSWANRGRLGGAFVAMTLSPQVTTVAGRKAVLFEHPRWTVPLENQALVSDFIMPLTELYTRPLTLVADVCNLERAESRETLLSFAPLAGKDGVQFSYGCFKALDWYGDKLEFAPERFPRFGEWHRLVYVIERAPADDKKEHGTATLHVDGRFVARKTLRRTDKRPLADNHAFIGAFWEDAWGGSWMARPSEPFTGAISGLALYDRVVPLHELAATPWPATAASAPQPQHGERLTTLSPTLAWQPAAGSTGAVRVYLGRDRAAVDQGAASALLTEVAGTSCPTKALQNDATYFWKVVPAGAQATQVPTWEFIAHDGSARQPSPAAGANEVRSDLVSLRWVPGVGTDQQRLIFGTDAAAVAAGTATVVTLAPGHDEVFITTRHLLADKNKAAGGGAVGGDANAAPEGGEKHDDGDPAYLPLARLVPATTYHWRVEQVSGDGKRERRIAGPVWSFTTAPVDFDDDGPTPEPFPTAIRQDGYYGRYLQCPGSPIICPPDALDEYMRVARHSIMKITSRRPDVVQALASANAACHLSTPESPGWSAGNGWSQFTCAAYGGAYSIARKSAIVMHEMGHQFHMYGCEWLDPQFKERHKLNFIANYRERKWMGGYGAVNKHENFAVWTSGWINDGTWDVGATSPREVLRRADPRMYHLLSEYLPGDDLVVLDALRGVQAAPDGAVQAWDNHGGVEYYDHGWRRYARTVGRFTAHGQPRLATVGGVGALAFDGRSELRWDQTTWEALAGNRAWAVEAWIHRARPASGSETLLEWGNGPTGARLGWGADGSAWEAGGRSGRFALAPVVGRWHQVIWSYSGGGLADGAGTLSVHVDGRLDHQVQVKLTLAGGVPLVLGRGFTGALAWLRVHTSDVHPQELALIARDDGFFQRDDVAVAGSLLVDLAADQLPPYRQPDVWPTVPPSLQQPWVRSWSNRGLLGGRLFNDGGATRQHGPLPVQHQGVPALSFTKQARMAGAVLPEPPAEATIEAWVSTGVADPAATVAQWGALSLPAALVPAGGWHHVAVTLQGGRRTAYRDGQAVALPASATPMSSGPPRLALGAHWDGRAWSGHFTGMIAQVRIHAGALNAQQVAANARRSGPARAGSPSPAIDALVPSPQGVALRWEAVGEAEVYLGTDRAAVAAAERGTAGVHLGRHRPGACTPTLAGGREYFWRVDTVDAAGTVLARGRVWSFRVGHGLVVDLRGEDLVAGSFSTWRNRGSAGGAFIPVSTARLRQPFAERRDGRAAVNWDGERSLVSSFRLPEAASQRFTVAAWLMAEDLPGGAKDRSNTWLSLGLRDDGGCDFLWNWQPDGGLLLSGTKKQRVELGYRTGITDVKAARAAAPAFLAMRWHHVAYCYGDGVMRVFVDGRLNREERLALSLPTGAPLRLGSGQSERRLESWFNGWIADVVVTGRVLDQAAVERLMREGAGTGGDWLVRLDAGDLAGGPVATWPNRGSLGGGFAPDGEPPRAPVVDEVEGRRAATFDGRTTGLCSDVPTPATVTGGRPFTVEVELFNPRLDRVETVLALAPALAMHNNARHVLPRMANCNVGSVKPPAAGARDNDYPSAFVGGKPTLAWSEPPPAGRWCRVTWVYSGGRDGEVRCYVDGRPAAARGAVSLNTVDGQPMYLGCDWNTAMGPLSRFSGSIGSVRVWDHAQGAEEIAARRPGR